jgi:hypothetical protein
VRGALIGFVIVFPPALALASLIRSDVVFWLWVAGLIAGPATGCFLALRRQAQPAAGWTAGVLAVVLPAPGFFALVPSPSMFVAAPLAVVVAALVARGAVELALRIRLRQLPAS